MFMPSKMGAISGCTVYLAPNGVADPMPSVMDTNVTLPQVSFPESPIQAMGDMQVPDQTRLNSMTCTISVETEADYLHLLGDGGGVQSYVIRWCQQKVLQTGEVKYEDFQAYISGMISQLPAASLQVGQSGASDITISVFKYRLTQNGSKELISADRTAGILRINGKSLRDELENAL